MGQVHGRIANSEPKSPDLLLMSLHQELKLLVHTTRGTLVTSPS